MVNEVLNPQIMVNNQSKTQYTDQAVFSHKML